MIKVNCPNCGVRLNAPDELAGKPVNCQKCQSKFILSTRWANEPLSVGSAQGAQRISQPSSDSDLGSQPDSSRAESKSYGSGSAVDYQADSATRSASQLPVPAPSQPNSLLVESAYAPVSASLPIASVDLESGNQESQPADAGSTLRPVVKEVDAQLRSIAKAESSQRLRRFDIDGFTESDSLLDLFDFRFRRYLTPIILKASWVVVMFVAVGWGLLATFGYASSILNASSFQVGGAATNPITDNLSPQILKTGIFAGFLLGIVMALLWIRVLFESILMLFHMGNLMRINRTNVEG